jgi:membrane-associated protein
MGYFLGEIRVIKDNLDYAALVILIASLTPVALEYRRHRRRAAQAEG